jgi:uncharacterized protein YkwD
MALTAQRKPTIHHRKSRGQHHRRGKTYLKTYSPYLPLLLVAIIGLAINSFWSSRSHVLGAATNLTSSELLLDTNLERSRQQEPDLALNAKLNAAAQAKANDMVQRDYWSHNAPDGTTPWSFVQTNGYEYHAAGENLAYGFMNARTIITGWMNSPEHRANVLNRNYQDIGFGIATAEDYQGKGPTTVVVAMYGQPESSNLGVSATVSGTHPEVAAATTNQPFRKISRVDVLTGGAAPWSFAVLSALTLLALAFLVFRHALAWHRMLIKSEDFVLSHKKLDIAIAGLLVVSMLLTRTSGFIN